MIDLETLLADVLVTSTSTANLDGNIVFDRVFARDLAGALRNSGRDHHVDVIGNFHDESSCDQCVWRVCDGQRVSESGGAAALALLDYREAHVCSSRDQYSYCN